LKNQKTFIENCLRLRGEVMGFGFSFRTAKFGFLRHSLPSPEHSVAATR